MDWNKYPNFSENEFRCKHTGKCEMDPEFMDKLQALRTAYGKPIIISSGYRHWSHPVEMQKGHKYGEHTQGRCCDIAVSGSAALELLGLVIAHGFTRVGVQQKGAGRFLHVGLGGHGLAVPALWTY